MVLLLTVPHSHNWSWGLSPSTFSNPMLAAQVVQRRGDSHVNPCPGGRRERAGAAWLRWAGWSPALSREAFSLM